MVAFKIHDILAFIDDPILTHAYVKDFYPVEMNQKCESWILYHFLEAFFETYDDNPKIFSEIMDKLSDSLSYYTVFLDQIIKAFLDKHNNIFIEENINKLTQLLNEHNI